MKLSYFFRRKLKRNLEIIKQSSEVAVEEKYVVEVVAETKELEPNTDPTFKQQSSLNVLNSGKNKANEEVEK